MEEPMGDSNNMGIDDIPHMGQDMPEQPMDASEEMDNEGGDDKKKEIQKLAGELSELLHTYNEENGEDEELNKYVKGMIDAQTDGSDDDSVNTEDMPEDENEFDPEADDDNNPEMDAESEEMSQPDIKQEGKTFTKKQLREEFGKAIKNKKDVENFRLDKKLNKTNVNKQNPFMPPKFN